jgi:hypothetical protein
MTMNAFGPASLRHNDLWMVGRSGINGVMAHIQMGRLLQKLIYGDSIYVWMTHLRSRHGNGGTPREQAEDKALSSCRQLIEHNYGESDQLFPYLTYKHNLKILAGTPLGSIYFTKLLFRNLYVCLYGNKTWERMHHPRKPTLEEYMVRR